MFIYEFDLSSGYIYTCCKVPVNLPARSTHHAAIRYHEGTDIHKGSGRRPSTPDEIAAIVSSFTEYVSTCAENIRACLPCKASANACFLASVGVAEVYDYCSECKILTVDKENHNSRQCISKGYFKEKKMGVKNKFWTDRNPRIITVEEFDLDDDKSKQHMCLLFHKKPQLPVHSTLPVVGQLSRERIFDDE
jgi:hypothetical protein